MIYLAIFPFRNQACEQASTKSASIATDMLKYAIVLWHASRTGAGFFVCEKDGVKLS